MFLLAPRSKHLCDVAEDLPQQVFASFRWWNVGYAKAAGGEDLNYLGVSGFRIAGGQGILIIAVCQVDI